MPKRPMKYNPAFLSPEDLERSFVVRQADLEWILRIVGENKGINQHILVIGPRGSGKTTLVLRVAAEVRRRPELNAQWYPLLFAEESYQVRTPGEFWLEAVLHLSAQTGDPDRRKSYAELQREKDEVRLRERALAHLLDFADSQGKRLLLVVENLNDLLGDEISDEDAWVLRHTLTNEPRIMLLASAVVRFDKIENESKAMFELFLQHELQPLDKDECRTLWEAVSGENIENDYIRPIQILTGGNPRLLSVIAHFGASLSFQDLMRDLLELVDDNTEYFKSHIEALPGAERRVYLSLTEIWDPATAREVAEKARLDVSQTSASLNRLLGRGMVRIYEEKSRTKLYCTSERLYSIYYLLRRRGMPTDRVRALVNFMTAYYAPPKLAVILRRIAEEACKLQPALRNDHYCLYDGILRRIDSHSLRQQLIEAAPIEFFNDIEAPTDIRRWVEQRKTTSASLARGRDITLHPDLIATLKIANDEANELIRLAQEAAADPSRVEEAEALYQQAIAAAPESADALRIFAKFLMESQRYEDALEALRKVADMKGRYSDYLRVSNLLVRLDQLDEAAEWARRAISRDEKQAVGWMTLGRALSCKSVCQEDALAAFSQAIELDPELTLAWELMGHLLSKIPGRDEEALAAFRRTVQLDGGNALTWTKIACILSTQGKYAEAEEAFRKSIEAEPGDPLVWKGLALCLWLEPEAGDRNLQVFRKAAELNPNEALLWAILAMHLSAAGDESLEGANAAARALELDPKNTMAWMAYSVTALKHEEYENVVAGLNQAVQLNPSFHCGWALMGQTYHRRFHLLEEAEHAYRRAIALCPKDIESFKGLIEILCQSGSRSQEALDLAEQLLCGRSNDAELLNAVAWGMYMVGCVQHTGDVEQWARTAAELRPEVTNIRHTLACVLCAAGKGVEALENAELYFKDRNLVQENVEDATELVIALAVAGQGLEALELLKRSPAASALEPLEAGLRRFLGQETKVALEIYEVGKDVAQRIEDRCRKLNETAQGQSVVADEGKALGVNDTGNDVECR